MYTHTYIGICTVADLRTTNINNLGKGAGKLKTAHTQFQIYIYSRSS